MARDQARVVARHRSRRGGSLTRRASLLALALVVAGAGVIVPRSARADSTSVALPAWLSETTLNGFVSSSYSYNFNRPSSGANDDRVFDFDDATFTLDVFELVLQKPAMKPRDTGFRVDLAMGGSIPRVTAASGLFRDASGRAEDFDLQQAFATFVAPAGSGVRLDVGKFVTHCGDELIDGYDGWNDQATRSFLFGFAIPFTHTGVRGSYTFSPRASVMAMCVNGWDVARDDNRAKSLGAQLALTPVAPLSIVLNGMWGPERPDDDAHARTLLDAVVTLKDTRGRSIGLNGDWAEENWRPKPSDIGDADPVHPFHHWSGIAAYGRYPLTSALALTARVEYFDDRNGQRTGVAQDLWEWTVTPEWRLTSHLIARADARRDRSNRSVFEKSHHRVHAQPTVLANVLYAF